jgi:hypothetical protein
MFFSFSKSNALSCLSFHSFMEVLQNLSSLRSQLLDRQSLQFDIRNVVPNKHYVLLGAESTVCLPILDQGLMPLDPNAACGGLLLRLRRPCWDAARPRNTAK